MNLEGVALAADSAVTTNLRGSQKIFSSQNKLFELSDVAPVGVLFYGNASFMSIPWETLIKEYRKRRGRKTFDHLNDYVDDFCEFLAGHISGFITSDHQDTFIKALVRHIYSAIRNDIQNRVNEELANTLMDNPPSQEHLEEVFHKVTVETAGEYHERAERAPPVEGMPTDPVANFWENRHEELKEIRHEVFRHELPQESVKKLDDIAGMVVGKMLDDILEEPSGMNTGIVIAGFGENDFFPAYSEIIIEGLTGEILKKRSGRNGESGPDNEAIIVAFAQDEMIHQFMEGIAPVYLWYLHQSVISHLNEYSERLLASLERYSEEEKAAIHESIKNVHPVIADLFLKQLQEVADLYSADEILDVVTTLPKNELAEMAEALVSLTSLKRKISLQDETVGGPTDVAVITKGDGLIWVKRKNYFPAALNHAYFAREYPGGDGNATD